MKGLINIRYLFSDKELKKIKDNLIIIVDTREKRNEHILDFFRSKNINYCIENIKSHNW